MHKPAVVLENDTHKLLWDFDIQKDHLISSTRPDQILINRKKRELAIFFSVLADQRIKLKESEKKDKYLDLARELKKPRNMMVLFTNPSARAGYDTRSIFKRSLTGLNSEFSFS